jgi:hypothetical protein
MIRSPQVSWGGLLTRCIHSLFPQIDKKARNVPKKNNRIVFTAIRIIISDSK